MIDTFPKMLTLRQAAELSGLGYSVIRRFCLSGQLAHIKSGTKYLVNEAVLKVFLEGKKANDNN